MLFLSLQVELLRWQSLVFESLHNVGNTLRGEAFVEIIWFLFCSKLNFLAYVSKEIVIIMTGGRVEAVSSTGCSRLFVGSSTSIPSLNFLRSTVMMSPASSAPPESEPRVPSVVGPFTGLVICVTGLSKGNYRLHFPSICANSPSILLSLFSYCFPSPVIFIIASQ